MLSSSISNPSFQCLKIHTINVNSLVARDKRHTLDLHLKKHKPDFVLISETRLKAFHKVSFNNYTIIRNDQQNGTRGTAILIKDIYQFKEVKIIPIPSMECTSISVRFQSRTLFIFSIYQTGNKVIDCNDLHRFIDKAGDLDCFIIGGDFNARHTSWKNNTINANGNKLFKWLETYRNSLDIRLFHSTNPSRFGHNSFSYIDLFLTSASFQVLTNNRLNSLDTFAFDSDHFIVELKINLPKLEAKEPKFILNFEKANWKLINDYLSEVLINSMPRVDCNLSIDEIDHEIAKLNDLIVDALDRYVPKIKMLPGNLLILKEVTIKCIKLKRSLRRRWFRSGCRDSSTKSFIERISTIIKNLITTQYSSWYETKMKAIKPGPNMFRSLKNFCGNPNRVLPGLENCSNDDECAEALAQHFSNVHNNSLAANTPNCLDPNIFAEELKSSARCPLMQFSDRVPADKSVVCPDQLYSTLLSIGSTHDIIRSRKNLKSAGQNKLSNYVMRRLPTEYSHFLCIIINNCYNLGYFPNIWKKAIVVPIPKGKPSGNIEQYRPISLLNCESKIYECFLRDILNELYEEHDLINPLQFGFTKARSTNHAVSYFLENVHFGFNDKLPTLAVSLDLKKAFDTVWVNGLVYKMHLNRIPNHLCKIILDFLSGRSFAVRYRDALSDFCEIRAGVPQGSILGPSLFNFFIFDFPVNNMNQIKTIFFADDILLFKQSNNITRLISDINNYLVVVNNYLLQWNLSVNPAKCESILIRKSDTHITKRFKLYKNVDNIKVKIDGQTISSKNTIKYLGVTIDRKLSVIPHIDRTLNKANAAYHMVKNILNKKFISSKVKVLAYKQLIRPIITYNFPGWCSLSSRQMERLRSCERKILYRCLPLSVAYKYNEDVQFYRLISKKSLYEHVSKLEKKPKLKRLDVVCIELFLNFCRRLEFCHLPELRRIIDINQNAIIHENNSDRYMYKSFPPSFLYLLHMNGSLYSDGNLIFYNRKFNSNTLDNFVYDLLEPD